MSVLNIKGGILWKEGDLFHISFNEKLEGMWVPREVEVYDDPEGVKDKEPWPYPEPSMKSISCSPSLQGCFIGVYPNVWWLFRGTECKHIDFSVYRPRLKGREKILLPEDLTQERMVWDAHVTQEHRILDPVFMERVGSIRVFNTERTASLKTHPFNDPKLPLTTCGPKTVDIERLS